MSNARHNQLVRTRHSFGIAGDNTIVAEAPERLDHRRQIPRAIINDGNHNSPFVLGSMRASARSRTHATRSARANALKELQPCDDSIDRTAHAREYWLVRLARNPRR